MTDETNDPTQPMAEVFRLDQEAAATEDLTRDQEGWAVHLEGQRAAIFQRNADGMHTAAKANLTDAATEAVRIASTLAIILTAAKVIRGVFGR